MTRGRGLAVELAALTLILAAHVVLLTRLLHGATSFDEGVYVASLAELRDGAALGRDLFTSQGPGFYVILRAIGALAGGTVTDVRLGVVAIDVAGAVFAFLLVRRLAGAAGGLLAAGLIAVAPTLPEVGGHIYADGPAMALALCALWLALTARAAPAGAVFAAAVLVKVSALTAAATLVALLALAAGRRALVRALAGAAAVAVVTAAVYARDLTAIWHDAVSYHVSARHIGGLSGRHELANFWDTSLHTLFLWFTITGALASVRVWRRVWPLWLWAACAFLFVAEFKPLRDNHLIVLPYAFAVPVAAAVGLVARELPRRALPAAAAAAVVALAFAWLQQLHRVDLFRGRENPALLAAAATLRDVTTPRDVVVSDQPIVPFLAARRMPPDLVDSSSLRFDTGSLSTDRVLRAIDGDGRVAAAVIGRAFAARPALVAGIRARFRHRVRPAGIWIFYGRNR